MIHALNHWNQFGSKQDFFLTSLRCLKVCLTKCEWWEVSKKKNGFLYKMGPKDVKTLPVLTENVCLEVLIQICSPRWWMWLSWYLKWDSNHLPISGISCQHSHTPFLVCRLSPSGEVSRKSINAHPHNPISGCQPQEDGQLGSLPDQRLPIR